ncbi:MAG: Cna B-type domain-containing protein, partial [Bacteroidales bacterium]|nr:Cna B-type domain-containing protein [Bacteroidales bacterium]
SEFKLEKVENPLPEKKETIPYEGTGLLGNVHVGDNITYEIFYWNYHEEAATVTVVDTLDKNVEFVSATPEGKFIHENGVVTWTLADVPAKTSGTVTLTVKVLPGAQKSNGGNGSVINEGTTVQVGNDNKYTLQPVENPVPEKREIEPYEGTGVLGPVSVGEEITYEIYYRNYKDVATTVTIKDQLDDHVAFVSANNGGTNAAPAEPVEAGGGGVVTWTLENVPAGQDGIVTLTVVVLPGALVSEKGPGKVVNGGDTTTVKVNGDAEFSLQVVENPVPETAAEVIKTWDDKDNRDGRRPETVTMKLYANNVDTGFSVTLSDDADQFAFTAPETVKPQFAPVVGENTDTAAGRALRARVSRLPRYVNGVEQIYTWIEDLALLDETGYSIGDYAVTVNADGEPTFTITNTYDSKRFCLAVIKVWEDQGNLEGFRPTEITAELYKKVTITEAPGYRYEPALDDTGEPISFRLNAGNGWAAMALGVPIYENGERINYYWKETCAEADAVNFGKYSGNADADGYIPASIGLAEGDSNTHIAQFVNTLNNEKVTVSITKTWDDANNQDGVRWSATDYAGIVGLYEGVGENQQLVTGVTPIITDNGDNTYTVTYTGLSKYAEGNDTEPIVYTVLEDTDAVEAAGYVVTYDENGNITNKYIPETKTIKATKVWAGEGSFTGLRKEVKLTLSGTYVVDEVTHIYNVPTAEQTKTIAVGAENQYVEWTNLPVYKEGSEITYVVTEAEIPGYTTTYGTLTKGEDGLWTIEITNTLDVGELDFTKNLFVDNVDKTGDAEYEDKIFHAVVSTKIDGTTYYVTGATGGLSKSKDDAEVFDFASGDVVSITNLPVGTYTVTEVTAAGAAVGGTVKPDADFGAMTWLESLSRVELTIVVKAAAAETTEPTEPGDAGTGNAEAETKEVEALVNTYTSGRYCIAVTKQWLVNGEVVEGEDLEVTLTRGTYTGTPANEGGTPAFVLDEDFSETYTLTKYNNWSTMAVGMPQMDANGNRYDYIWTEGKHDGWAEGEQIVVQDVETDDGATLIVLTKLTNSKATAEIPVKKIMTEGTSDYPGTFTFTLASEDENAVLPDESERTLTLSVGDDGVFGPLTFSAPGTYTYTITEDTTNTNITGLTYDPENPKTVVIKVEWATKETEESANGESEPSEADETEPEKLPYLKATVTFEDVELKDPIEFENEYIPETIDIDAYKYWYQAGVEESINGLIENATITFTLEESLNNEDWSETAHEKNPQTVTEANADGEWKATWEKLPKYALIKNSEGEIEQVLILYRVVESEVLVDDVDVTPVEEADTIADVAKNEDTDKYEAILTNTLPTVNIPVTKVWSDDIELADDDYVVFGLYSDKDEEFEETLELNAANEWAGSFDKLPAFTDEGELITYTVKEIEVKLGEIELDDPDEIKELFGNEDWDVTYEDVPEDEDFSVEIANSIRGSLTVEKIVTISDGEDENVTGKFFFVAVKDANGSFYALNGENVGADPHWIEITNGESRTWENLPFGTYMVVENEDLAEVLGYAFTPAYSVKVKTDSDEPAWKDGQEITLGSTNVNGQAKVENKYTPETTEATVIKVWNDKNDDEAAERRKDAKIYVTLLANNMGVAGYNEIYLPYDMEAEDADPNITYTEKDNTWTLTVKNLPLYVEGVYQSYSWTETITDDTNYAMTAISTTSDETGAATTTIANTDGTERYCLEVLKVWDDDNDSAGFRPTTLKVTLMKLVDGEAEAFGENELLDAEGKPIQTEYTLSEENHWTAMVTSVPKGEFEYTWVEDDSAIADIYTSETETVGTITTLINSYTPETIEIEIEKVWDDNDDQDGVRPDHIDVKLMAGNEFVKTIRLEGEAWSYSESGLPKYANGEE